jgi:hypothetical protein
VRSGKEREGYGILGNGKWLKVGDALKEKDNMLKGQTHYHNNHLFIWIGKFVALLEIYLKF